MDVLIIFILSEISRDLTIVYFLHELKCLITYILLIIDMLEPKS